MDPLTLKANQEYSRDGLLKDLFELSYAREEPVLKPGEFSERGSLIDVYPVGFRNPLRLIFELDTLHAIKDFSPVSGELLGSFKEVTLLPLTREAERKISKLTAYFLDEKERPKPGDFVVHTQYKDHQPSFSCVPQDPQ